MHDWPLTNLDSTVVPAGICKVHAMMVQGGMLIERVEGMEDDSIIGAGIDGGRGPRAIDADSSAREQTVWIDILD